MLLCSLKQHINWCEQGLKFVSWCFDKIESGNADNLNQIFKKYSTLSYDKRKKKQRRTISIGDIIILDDTSWIVSSFGFVRIPEILWNKVKKKG